MNTSAIKVSVIVPVYNTAHFLDFCIKSLLEQTHKNTELIFIDDASTDNSKEVLLKYRDSYPEKIKIIFFARNKKQGAGRNEGLKMATGNYVTYVDSDDWVHPEYIETLLAALLQENGDIARCPTFSFSQERDKKFSSNLKEQKYIVLDKYGRLRSGAGIGGLMGRRELLLKTPPFPENMYAEDLVFTTFLYKLSRKMVFIPSKMYGYRRVHSVSLKPNLHYDAVKALLILREANIEEDVFVYKSFYTLSNFLKSNLRSFWGAASETCFYLQSEPWNLILAEWEKIDRKKFMEGFENISGRSRAYSDSLYKFLYKKGSLMLFRKNILERKIKKIFKRRKI